MKGFTLIELLVVVLIIGVLSAVALPQYHVAVEKASFPQGVALFREVARSLRLYYMANGEYPPSLEELELEIGPVTKWADNNWTKGDFRIIYANRGSIGVYKDPIWHNWSLNGLLSDSDFYCRYKDPAMTEKEIKKAQAVCAGFATKTPQGTYLVGTF